MSDLTQVCQPVLDGLADLPPIERILAANQLAEQLQEVQVHLANTRRAGVRELRAAGMTFAAIGEKLGLTAPRVKQIEAGYGRPKS